jgi:2-polyprenyl-3-methyl-5-hydroxy-6-metoxy-1,4-benzoquinol methylase
MSADWYVQFFSGLALELWRKAVPPEVTAAEADFVEHALALGAPPRGAVRTGRGPKGAAVLDVPCGNGRLALELARRGHRVTGVELAPEYLAEARAAAQAEGLAVDWRGGDMRRLARLLGPPRGRFDAALCWGNSFGYLDRPGTAAFTKALGGALRPGGRLVVETLMTAESLLPQLEQRFWVPVADMLLLVENDYDVGDSRLDIAYTFVHGARRETRQACHWVFTVGEIGEMLARAGFTVLELAADLERNPYTLGAERLLLVAEKTG